VKVGASELLVIFVVALLVLGPEKMPKYAKMAGKFLRSVKVYADKMAEDINESIVEPLEEVQEPLKKAAEPITSISKDIKKSVDTIGKPEKKVSVSEAQESKESKQEECEEKQETHEIKEAKETQEIKAEQES
jgi:sec-independent protein translocase protein TatB